MTLSSSFIPLMLFLFLGWTSQSETATNLTVKLSTEHISEGKSFTLTHWRAKTGDNFNWLTQNEYNDWLLIDSKLPEDELNKLDWSGIGWFFTEIEIDSSVAGSQIPIRFQLHQGASEVFVNGKLLFRMGTIDAFDINSFSHNDEYARFFIPTDAEPTIVAVRFANSKAFSFTKEGMNAGFELEILPYQSSLDDLKSHENDHTIIVFVLGVLSCIALVHFLLLIFYPSGQKNFYFTIIAAGIALFTLISFKETIFSNPEFYLALARLDYVAWFFVMLGLLRFAYSFQDNSTPLVLYLVVSVALITSLSGSFYWFDVTMIQGMLSVFVFLELLRVFAYQKVKKKASVDLIILGLVGFILSFSFTETDLKTIFLGGFPLLENFWGTTLFIALSSMYLLRDFAKAQIKLEYKYLEVKHLSERSVDQERKNKEKELQQKLLEAENKRKTAELEEARALQLSMLPSKIPSNHFWNIAVYMETAHEVGGDYYDFSQKGDSLTIAIGDATGHGMKAGIIVAAAKSYFHSLAGEESLVQLLKKMSHGIRNMDLKLLYMGMMLLKFEQRSVTFASAGMPPALLYRKATHTVEEVLLKAMPLGTKIDFPYQTLEYSVEKGDIFILLSDGLMELFDVNRNQIGLEPIKELLVENSEKDAQTIVSVIKETQLAWSGKAAQEDDVTVMVLKAT